MRLRELLSTTTKFGTEKNGTCHPLGGNLGHRSSLRLGREVCSRLPRRHDRGRVWVSREDAEAYYCQMEIDGQTMESAHHDLLCDGQAILQYLAYGQNWRGRNHDT
jgi:hypothetical protein